MTGTSKLLALAAALLLIFGVAACGDEESNTDSSPAQSNSRPDASTPKQSDETKGEGSGKSKSADDSDGKDESKGSEGKSASDFVPKQHSDSGGGSQELRVKGGDNSIQEFGEEADESEFEEAATALHNFLDARAEGNWAAVCEYMSSSQIKSFEQLAQRIDDGEALSCAETLERMTNPAAQQELTEEAKQADVRSLRYEGERGFIIYTGLDETVIAIAMENENGRWKVAGLAGVPIS